MSETVPSDIEEKMQQISAIVDLKQQHMLATVLDTNVAYLKHLVQYIPHLESKKYVSFQRWLGVLLECPFAITKVLDSTEIDALVGFLVLCSCLDAATSKISARNLALVAHNMYVTGDKAIYDIAETTIGGTRVTKITFFRFLKQLAAIGGAQDVDTAIVKGESAIVKRYKLKIMSYQVMRKYVSPAVAMNVYKLFLNESDTKMGWTLSKCFHRVLRCVEKEPVLNSLAVNLDKVFANEHMWINTATIMAFCALEGVVAREADNIIAKMLCYDNESVQRSDLVRETALFLAWAVIRSNAPLRDINQVIIAGLLDVSLQCRRAASTVLLEYVGRNKVAFGNEILDIVNFNSVKRIPLIVQECARVAEIVPALRPQILDALRMNIGHYDRELRTACARCFCVLTSVCPCTFDMIGGQYHFHHGLIVYTLEFLSKHELCGLCLQNENSIFGYAIDTETFAYGGVGDLVAEYLALVTKNVAEMDAEALRKNVVFLLDKNFESDLIVGVSKSMVHDPAFSDLLFKNLARKNSEAYILANAFNAGFEKEVDGKYAENLAMGTIKRKVATMRALRLSGRANAWAKSIEQGIENYDVDVCGDVGVWMRIECLLAALALDNKTVFERHFVRFFVDKSKLLRDILVKQSAPGIYEEEFAFLRCDPSMMDILSVTGSLESLHDFLSEYYRHHILLKRESDLGHDKIHFESSLRAYEMLHEDLGREFFLGVVCTMKSSDASIFHFLLERLYAMRGCMYSHAVLCLQVSGERLNRDNVLCLFFVEKMLEKEKSAEDGSQEQQPNVVQGAVFGDSQELYDCVHRARVLAKSEYVTALCERIVGMLPGCSAKQQC